MATIIWNDPRMRRGNGPSLASFTKSLIFKSRIMNNLLGDERSVALIRLHAMTYVQVVSLDGNERQQGLEGVPPAFV
jgi:hypothetical protein